jgi:hypothetical protein
MVMTVMMPENLCSHTQLYFSVTAAPLEPQPRLLIFCSVGDCTPGLIVQSKCFITKWHPKLLAFIFNQSSAFHQSN